MDWTLTSVSGSVVNTVRLFVLQILEITQTAQLLNHLCEQEWINLVRSSPIPFYDVLFSVASGVHKIYHFTSRNNINWQNHSLNRRNPFDFVILEHTHSLHCFLFCFTPYGLIWVQTSFIIMYWFIQRKFNFNENAFVTSSFSYTNHVSYPTRQLLLVMLVKLSTHL